MLKLHAIEIAPDRFIMIPIRLLDPSGPFARKPLYRRGGGPASSEENPGISREPFRRPRRTVYRDVEMAGFSAAADDQTRLMVRPPGAPIGRS
jgi:hypothetical protein